MENRKAIKSIANILGLMVGLQLLRMAIEQGFFLFVKRTNFTDDLATMLAMLVLTIAFVIISSARGVQLSIFPRKFGVFYFIETLVLLGLLGSTFIMFSDKTAQTLALLLYSSVVTPIFEEIIFRGYIWNKLNTIFKREATTYIAVTLLFAVWHLGYIEGIAFRAPNGLAVTMLWKVAIGCCFGIILGATRLKTKNCYSTILLHGILNIFGR